MKTLRITGCLSAIIILAGCEYVDHTGESGYPSVRVDIDSVARLLSYLPIGAEQVLEVKAAVS